MGFIDMNLTDYDISQERGFLPETDPPVSLPNEYQSWEEIANQIPKFLVSDQLRTLVDALPLINIDNLKSNPLKERAMMLLSYIGHAYVWFTGKPVAKIPASLAVPWYELSVLLKRPPVLSYPSYALWNWRRINKNRPIELGNIALLQNFFAGADEEWFILVHVDIEAKAAGAIARLPGLSRLAKSGAIQDLQAELSKISECIQAMYASMERMPEYCDPYIYYNRVRPYIHGWKNNPSLPDGLVYEGVGAYNGVGQKFRGETGAQSGIVPALDAAFGVKHKDDFMKAYLLEMRDYMPHKHRLFLEELEKESELRELLENKYKNEAKVIEAYNSCIQWLSKFRTIHIQYAVSYIEKQNQTSLSNPTKIGTGGTPFVPYLTKHRDETLDHLI
jgi:indoleamine 2,3-dioxygenase